MSSALVPSLSVRTHDLLSGVSGSTAHTSYVRKSGDTMSGALTVAMGAYGSAAYYPHQVKASQDYAVIAERAGVVDPHPGPGLALYPEGLVGIGTYPVAEVFSLARGSTKDGMVTVGGSYLYGPPFVVVDNEGIFSTMGVGPAGPNGVWALCDNETGMAGFGAWPWGGGVGFEQAGLFVSDPTAAGTWLLPSGACAYTMVGTAPGNARYALTQLGTGHGFLWDLDVSEMWSPNALWSWRDASSEASIVVGQPPGWARNGIALTGIGLYDPNVVVGGGSQTILLDPTGAALGGVPLLSVEQTSVGLVLVSAGVVGPLMGLDAAGLIEGIPAAAMSSPDAILVGSDKYSEGPYLYMFPDAAGCTSFPLAGYAAILTLPLTPHNGKLAITRHDPTVPVCLELDEPTCEIGLGAADGTGRPGRLLVKADAAAVGFYPALDIREDSTGVRWYSWWTTTGQLRRHSAVPTSDADGVAVGP